ncbi:glutathione hydrolase 5 proenzyme-like [Heptranchias perlo]|uniref:glutathione hydrolase 5 proenzyme-like n=1 Tax=Heptranchias perlo TaxID=212740 RepID=UPI00355981AC
MMKKWRGSCCLVVLLVAALVAAGIVLILFWRSRCRGENFYTHAAVAADSETCSHIGRNILEQGGSAVDGAIAALLCTSLINPQSMGIGGGAIFTIYNRSQGRVTVINAREAVPEKVMPGLLTGCSRLNPGTQWIAVPGELRGYWKAHEQFGKLPWKSLFEPTIQLAETGFRLPELLRKFLEHQQLRHFINNSLLRTLFYNNFGEPLEFVRYHQLAKTLKVIADQGPDAFYNGQIAQDLITDIQEAAAAQKSDSTLTAEDLRRYKASVVKPLTVSLGDYMMYSPPLPTRGAILSFILNILKGFHFTRESMEGDQKVLTYHRIIEALKFGNGQLSRMTDPTFRPYNLSVLLSDRFAELMRQRIDNEAHPLQYYNIEHQAMEKYSTSHISVLDKDGNAVSVTSTINQIFGSMIFSPRTGIILNNQLADFCRADRSPSNIAGQPPSSMSPSILISQDRKSIMVVGGAGGSMILSATAQVIMNKLWFGLSMKEAIEKKRIHIISDNSLQFEEEFDERVKNEMKRKGHTITSPSQLPSVIQGIFADQVCIEAVSDSRKYGKSAGY